MELCVALDNKTHDENLALVTLLKDKPLWYKVGFRSFIRDGIKAIEMIKKLNPENKIFLDLKLYDIPNTMADAAEELAKMGVDMFNVHASSGRVAMQMVMERVSCVQNPPLVLAVTALTSFDEGGFQAIYLESIKHRVDYFAKEAMASGLDGVVCSAHEASYIKEITSDDFITLSPGIRPEGSDANDQERVATPRFALENRVDIAVVGRPIYKAENPKKVVEAIIKSIN